MKKVSANIMELFEKDRTIRAEKAIDALLKIYHNKKETLPPEVVDICEKHLIGYWDVKIAKKSYKSKAKK